MSEAMAVLSYTRKDDDFFGGYITAFRKTLETAVHVVSGTQDFRIFQDIEGIVIGEQWQKRLTDVIGSASFLVPMVSPLFLNSRACREEVDMFLAHERQLQRDDLILPVYFLSSAKLEKDEEKAKDPLAIELAKRQMFDWRENANLPLQEPAARQAILTLAGAVSKAVERLETPATSPGGTPATGGARGPADASDASLANVYGRTKREKLSERAILWVDDSPDNNVWERRALESYGVHFVLAFDTAQAQARLHDGTFNAVISDLSRPGDRRAGYTLLRLMRDEGMQTPYFIYSSSRAPKRVREARERGAQGATNDPDDLVAMVVAAIR
jgi:CheY-like chemotaxis protein